MNLICFKCVTRIQKGAVAERDGVCVWQDPNFEVLDRAVKDGPLRQAIAEPVLVEWSWFLAACLGGGLTRRRLVWLYFVVLLWLSFESCFIVELRQRQTRVFMLERYSE